MTAVAEGPGITPVLRHPRREQLVPVTRAARQLGRSADVLRDWINRGLVPSVRTFGAQLCVYASWLDAVLASARPGVPGDMAEVTRQWWAERGGQEAAG